MCSMPTGVATNPIRLVGVVETAVDVATEAAGATGHVHGPEIAPTRQ